MKKLGLLLISTGNYHQFVQPLIETVDKFFFPQRNIEIYLFCDREIPLEHSDRLNVLPIPTQHKPWPAPTLERYKLFSENASLMSDCQYVFYMDVDMLIQDTLNEGHLPAYPGHLIATRHCGFAQGGWGNHAENEQSTSFVPEHLRTDYIMGGFQGGQTDVYLDVCKQLAENIERDAQNGIVATWHDESHWNAYWKNNQPLGITFNPTFVMAEEQPGAFSAKIIALKKDHDAIRGVTQA